MVQNPHTFLKPECFFISYFDCIKSVQIYSKELPECFFLALHPYTSIIMLKFACINHIIFNVSLFFKDYINNIRRISIYFLCNLYYIDFYFSCDNFEVNLPSLHSLLPSVSPKLCCLPSTECVQYCQPLISLTLLAWLLLCCHLCTN